MGSISRVAPTSTGVSRIVPENWIENPGAMGLLSGESWQPEGARMNWKKLAVATPPPSCSTAGPPSLPTWKSMQGCSADSSAPTVMGIPWPGTPRGPATLEGSWPTAISLMPGVSVTRFTWSVMEALLTTRPSTPKASCHPASSVKVSDADAVCTMAS